MTYSRAINWTLAALATFAAGHRAESQIRVHPATSVIDARSESWPHPELTGTTLHGDIGSVSAGGNVIGVHLKHDGEAISVVELGQEPALFRDTGAAPTMARFVNDASVDNQGRVVFVAESVVQWPAGGLSSGDVRDGFGFQQFAGHLGATLEWNSPDSLGVIAAIGSPAPMGLVWHNVSDVRLTSYGDAYFLAVVETESGEILDHGLYRRAGASVSRVLGSGDSLLHGVRLEWAQPVVSYSIEQGGPRIVVHARIADRVSAADERVVVYQPSGDMEVVAREGDAISNSMPYSAWRVFRHIGAASGHFCGDEPWFVVGSADIDNGQREVVVRSGDVILQSGDDVDPREVGSHPGAREILRGDIAAFAVNSTGDYALVGLVGNEATIGSLALIVNGRAVLAAGDVILGSGVLPDREVAHVHSSCAVLARAPDGAVHGVAHVESIDSLGKIRDELVIVAAAAANHHMFCIADWDQNGGIDGGDLAAFFVSYEAGDADADCNGGTDGGDLATFFAHFEAGC